MNAAGIYEIVNTVNGKRYVGSAKRLNQRWNSHRQRLTAARHHSKHLQAAWSKYGAESFRFGVLLVCEPQNLILYEQIAIDSLVPEYNVAKVAGNTLGTRRTAETRAKIAEKALGRKWSEESRAKLSATTAGRKLPEERRLQLIGNQHAKGLNTPKSARLLSRCS